MEATTSTPRGPDRRAAALEGITVRDLRREEAAAAAGVLARGMRDNPLAVATCGEDPERRLRCYSRMMGALLRTMDPEEFICAIRAGTLVGVARVAPAGSCRPTTAQRLRMLPAIVSLGPGVAKRLGERFSIWGRRDPEEPHVHLGPFAVDAHLQGRGIGSRIMEEHCRRLETAGEVGYLETDAPDNIRLYERFGYEVIGEEPVLGIPNWFMRRELAAG